MASQNSEDTSYTCAPLEEDDIITESDVSDDDRSPIKTNSLDTTRNQRLAIKTALQFKIL
jgi:hypothetical protein